MKNTGKKNSRVFALCMALLWGVVFGSAMHDWTLGICMGLGFGAAFGLYGEEKEDAAPGKTGEEAELPDSGEEKPPEDE